MASFSVSCPKCPCFPPPFSSLLGLKSTKLSFQSGLLCLKQSQPLGSLTAESVTFGIRAEQSGTVAEDGKPVGIDMPLFVIVP